MLRGVCFSIIGVETGRIVEAKIRSKHDHRDGKLVSKGAWPTVAYVCHVLQKHMLCFPIIETMLRVNAGTVSVKTGVEE